MACSNFINRLVRRKFISADEVSSTQLKRCLTTMDLTALGIGSTLGLGIYVLAGKVAKDTAGPSVVVSFLVAAIASVFAGLCYAEFGARVPRTGSAYVYSYVTVGELIAFIIGWNLIMEYAIGTASVAKGYSNYLDFLIDHVMSKELSHIVPMNVTGLAPYPDFLAGGITLFLTGILAVGVKESSSFNNVFTFLNLLVVLYVVVCGAFRSDLKNWRLKESEIPKSPDKDYGVGGFFPYGISGMLAGAATCFYGFVGFDCIATTGEEVKNPKKAIPISIILSLLFIFLAYFGISMVTTLMIPYYAQDPDAPLPHVFEVVGWPVAKWIVAVGALAGLSTSLLGAMFPLPRIIYAMSADGLIFRFLSNVHKRFKTPLIATVIGGIVTALLALLFSIDELIEMMSIGTLMAYTLVAACILLLRYRYVHPNSRSCLYSPLLKRADSLDYRPKESDSSEDEIYGASVSQTNLTELPVRASLSVEVISTRNILLQYFNFNRITMPSNLSSEIVSWNVRIIALATIWLAANIIWLGDKIMDKVPWMLFLLVLDCVLIAVPMISIFLQPQNPEEITFKVPAVPFIPWLSLFINIFLMLKLAWMTWVRFAVWLAIGMLIYGFYGIRESSEEYVRKGMTPPSSRSIDDATEAKKGPLDPVQ